MFTIYLLREEDKRKAIASVEAINQRAQSDSNEEEEEGLSIGISHATIFDQGDATKA